MPEPIIPTPTEPTPAAPVTPPAPAGKTFSEEYVQALREEAKGHRLEKKAAQDKLRFIMGLTPDDEISDAKIAEFQQKQAGAITAALEKANARLIAAEIRSLDGYDTKLAERLIDKSKITVADDGTVTGIKEQMAELEKDFPAIKKGGAPTPGGANPPTPSGGKETIESLAEDYKKATRLEDRVRIRQKITLLQNKQEG